MEELKKFSSVLWDREDLVEIRCFPLKKGKEKVFPEQRWIKADELSQHVAWMQRMNQDKHGIYAGVLPRTEQGGGSDTDCLPGRVVWADVDHIEPRDAWKLMKGKKMPDPTLCISSGHGAHFYWLLLDMAAPEVLREVVGDLAVMLGSDTAVKNPSRVMRIPGFTNWKEPTAFTKILFESDHKFSLSELKAKIVTPKKVVCEGVPVESSQALERARRYLATIPGGTKGNLSNTLYKAACAMRDFGLVPNEAFSMLRGWDLAANNPPIASDDDIKAVVQNAWNYAKKAPGNKLEQQKHKIKISINTNSTQDFSELVEKIKDQMTGRNSTIPMPWNKLNFKTKALRPGTVVVVAGPTKVGKSYFLNNLAISLDGIGVAWRYLPLEDKKIDFSLRMLAILTNDYTMTDDEPQTAELRMIRALQHQEKLDRLMSRVQPNPRLGHKNPDGETEVPPVDYDMVVEWVRDALKDSRVVFVDPIAQIESVTREPWKEESKFIQKCLALAADANGVVVIAAHTAKRPGVSGSLSVEDVQGSAMLTRLAQTVILFDGHENEEVTVYGIGEDKYQAVANRTVTIGAARNGSGTRCRLAFFQGVDGPTFDELGIMAPKDKRRN